MLIIGYTVWGQVDGNSVLFAPFLHKSKTVLKIYFKN